MNKYRPAGVSVAVAVMAGAALTLTMASRGATEEPPCVVAKRWAEANRETLPTTLSTVSTLPLAYRRAAHELLSLAQRRSLWREHLATFLEPRFALSDSQRATIHLAISRIDRYVDAPGTSRAALGRDGFPELVRAQFGDSLGRVIFATLGPSARLTERSGDCNCSRSEDFCGGIGGGTHCGVTDCVTTITGCGWFWCSSCDGQCEDN